MSAHTSNFHTPERYALNSIYVKSGLYFVTFMVFQGIQDRYIVEFQALLYS